MPTGAALTEDGRLVVALDDGLHVVDADSRTVELLTPYPAGLGDRANDLNADLDGSLVTGTLNLAEGPGSYWWFSAAAGWRLLDEGIGNANGPVVLGGMQRKLVFADTRSNRLFIYDYDGVAGTVDERRIFADTSQVGGSPDGACADADGGVWSCILGPGTVVRYTVDGQDAAIDVGVELPSDITFGGPGLDAMFVTTIASNPDPSIAQGGQLLVIADSGYRGVPEPRFRL